MGNRRSSRDKEAKALRGNHRATEHQGLGAVEEGTYGQAGHGDGLVQGSARFLG